MKKFLLGLLVAMSFLSTSCGIKGGVGAHITYRNDDVDKKILDSVKVLDDKLLEGIKNNDAEKIIEISCKDLKKDSEKLKELVKVINEKTKGKSYEYQGRYYSKISSVGDYDFTINNYKDDPFDIKVKAVSKEMFVSLLKSNSKTDDYMVSLIYIKENKEWKLNTFYFNAYSCEGMNAIELYERAKALDDKGFKIPAFLNLSLSNKLLQPAPFVQFKREKEIVDFGQKAQANLNKNFVLPKKLQSGNNIEIYAFDIMYYKEGIIPIIKYTTKTELTKEKGIEDEANLINNEVCLLYPGMKESFKSFIYEAYSEPPVDSKKTYKRYRTLVNQK